MDDDWMMTATRVDVGPMVSPQFPRDLAFAALPALAFAIVDSSGPAFSQQADVTYNGTVYSLERAIKEYDPRIFTAPWYGKPAVAKGFAEATGVQLGSGLGNVNAAIYYAPFFFYDYPKNIDRKRSFCRLETVSTIAVSYVACEDNQGLPLSYERAFGFAVLGTPVPVAAQPVLNSGNVLGGSSLNLTSNIGQSLLPQFQGGTLTVSPAVTIVSSNFTLDSSATNTIDAAGNNATFSGVFSDQAGSKGAIKFLNSSSSSAVLRLNASSTYSGSTQILNNLALEVGVENALPVTTKLLVGAPSDVSAILRLDNVNQSIAGLGGFGQVELGLGSLTINPLPSAGSIFYGGIKGDGGLIKEGGGDQTLKGALDYSGPTEIRAGKLFIDGSSKSDVTISGGGTLGGVGVISATVNNFGTVSPGSSSATQIGTLTINNANYIQWDGAALELEVNGTQSDQLQITGSGTVTDLAGTVRIKGTPTAGRVYTGIAGPTAYRGSSTANADTSSVVIASGYKFCREDDACFTNLNGQPSVDKTKLQFGWVALDKDGKQQITVTDPKAAIDGGIQKGGPISRVVRGSGSPSNPPPSNQPSLQQTCVANTGNAAGCAAAIQGPPAQPPSQNVQKVAAGLDGGNAAVAAVVNNGVTGGSPIPTATGGTTGYTTKQAQAAGLPPDFVTVLYTVNSLPTRSAVISSLHQVTAEPYASMQSVALEAMEQFRSNALALSEGNQAIRLFTEAEACQLDDGTLIPAETPQRPSDCKPRKISSASRWSLLIDATNTQASLEGTNDLASLDYNIFQSTYGLQYDASRQWSLGGAFGYGQANLYNYEYANSTIDSNTYGGGLWAIYRPGDAWKITGLLGYMNLQYDSSRQIDFGGLNRTARANWSGNGFTSALEVQYDWILSANKADRNAVRLKPNTYLSYSLHSQGDITESGADSLNLAIDGHTADSLVYGIGFTLETPLQLAASTRLIPRLSVGYEYDFNGDSNEEHQLSASFAEVPALGSLDVLGQNRGANDLNVGLSVELETSDQLSLYAGVGGSFWSNGNELNYGGGVRWRFGGAPKATMAKAQTPAAPASQPSAAPAVEQPAPSIRGLW